VDTFPRVWRDNTELQYHEGEVVRQNDRARQAESHCGCLHTALQIAPLADDLGRFSKIRDYVGTVQCDAAAFSAGTLPAVS